MASILIIEDDGLVAGQMARTLSAAGHRPVQARDGQSALREAAERPDLVLLDLGLPDLPGEKVVTYLQCRPETASTPILVITGRREAAARLRKTGLTKVSEVLLKPVSPAQLCRAVEHALERPGSAEAEHARQGREKRRMLVQRLLFEGSDLLAFQVCLRLSEDRLADEQGASAEGVTWAEIAARAEQEGVLDGLEALLLRSMEAPEDAAA